MKEIILGSNLDSKIIARGIIFICKEIFLANREIILGSNFDSKIIVEGIIFIYKETFLLNNFLVKDFIVI